MSASPSLDQPIRPAPPAPAGERGWGKLLLGLAAFLVIPVFPHFRALLPVDQTILLFVPAMAACTLVGWWAGGRMILAVAWIGLAVFVATQTPTANATFFNLSRGWSLVLAGSFGLVCLVGVRRTFFPRALLALTVALGLGLMMSALGPVNGNHISNTVRDDLTRRNAVFMDSVNTFIRRRPEDWSELTKKVPQLANIPAEVEGQLQQLAKTGSVLYPSLLALQSLIALAIAWSVYHRLSRARLGPPLAPLRDFRFNDQLVWGLIVGLTFVFLPNLSSIGVVGWNLLVFFGALYSVRGLGVLSWFMAPGTLALSATVGFAMLFLPVLGFVAALGFVFLAVAALGLGLGDTWADWRRRARSTT
jgi:predicted membrane protein DUF2232